MLDLKELKKSVVLEFDPVLEGAGFRRILSKNDPHSFVVTYQSGNQYLCLQASIHPRDYPSDFRIILGEGSLEWPECDWNAVALWRIRNFLEKNDLGENFGLDNFSDANALALLAREHLQQFHAGFLDGNLEVFGKVRAQQTREREPYRIYQPQPDGLYSSMPIPESVLLKERFSKE